MDHVYENGDYKFFLDRLSVIMQNSVIFIITTFCIVDCMQGDDYMLEMFEKIINEHGSSVILKERIELINDKYEALEAKLENSLKENELLRKENDLLSTQLKEYQLNSEAQKAKSDSLPETQQSILKILFSNNDGVDENSLARQINLDMGSLGYHTDELLEKGLIEEPGMNMGNSFTGEPGYLTHYISKDGRKYVVEIIGI